MKRQGKFGIQLALASLALAPDAGADPLDTNVSDISTAYPTLVAQQYELRIAKADKGPNKAQNGELITFTMETTGAARSTKNEDVGPGHKMMHYVGVTPRTASEPGKRDYTNQDIAKGLAGIAKAAGLNATPRDIINNPKMLEGKVVLAKVKVAPETPEFPETNRIGDFLERK